MGEEQHNLLEQIFAKSGGVSLSSLVAQITGERLFAIRGGLDLTPRYGHERPPHRGLVQLFEKDVARYAENLRMIASMQNELARIPLTDADRSTASDPFWKTRWLPYLDLAALYAFVADRKPQRYLEVGSGVSTLFARKAIEDHRIDCEITSIDPQPRIDIGGACDVVVRTRLEHADIACFRELEAGDILFVDSSHRVFMNSDVTVLFMEVLPELQPGVIVHFHDIFLPFDYPKSWRHRLYAEQYMLAACLLLSPERFKILLPAMFASAHPELSGILDPMWTALRLDGESIHGGSFWMEMQ